MPIQPENRGRYPADWPAISDRIRFERAHGRCECEGECGEPHGGRCRNRHGCPSLVTGRPVTLTTAHLDHTPEHCADDNLKAFCNGCHLRYDAPHHAETAARTRREQATAGMEPLFPEAVTR